MPIATPKPDAPKNLSEVVKAKRAQIAADNEVAKAVRNARRNKQERDPAEYQKQKVEQREAYAAKIAAEEGREVRAYAKVPGQTRAEHDENARQRHAERERERRTNATQVEKNKDNDRKWAARQRKKGWTEDQIAEGLAKRAADRQAKPDAYESNPLHGAF